MKRFAAVFGIVALAAFTFAAACDKDNASKQAAAPQGTQVRQVALTGYLTDSYCGAANASAKGKSCAVECMKKGAKLQLYSSEKLYNLDKVDAPESHVGVEVKVMGTLDEATNTIKVASIENVTRG